MGHNGSLSRSPQIPRRNLFRPASGAAALAWALFALASCGGGKIPTTQYYQLHLPPAPAPGSAKTAFSVVVMPWKASDILTRDRIVYRPTREEVGYYEYHLWAEDPAKSVERAVVDGLESKGTFSTVGVFDGRTRSDFILRGRLERLEEVDYEGGVKVYAALSAELLDASSRRVVWTGEALESADVGASEMRDVVAKMSDAASAAVASLTADLDEYMRTRRSET